MPDQSSARAAVAMLQKELDVLEEEARLDAALGRNVVIASRSMGPQSFRSRSRRKIRGLAADRAAEASLGASESDTQLQEALEVMQELARRRKLQNVPKQDIPDAMRAALGGYQHRASPPSRPLSAHSAARSGSPRSTLRRTNSSIETIDDDTLTKRLAGLLGSTHRLHELGAAHKELYALLTAGQDAVEEVNTEGTDRILRLRELAAMHAARREAEARAEEIRLEESRRAPPPAAPRLATDELERRQREADEEAQRVYEEMRANLRAEVLYDVFGETGIVPPLRPVVSHDAIDTSLYPELGGPDATIDGILQSANGQRLFDTLLARERDLADAAAAHAQALEATDKARAELARTAERIHAQREPALRRKLEEQRLALAAAESAEADGEAAAETAPPAEAAAAPPRPVTRPHHGSDVLSGMQEELLQLEAVQAEVDAIRSERQLHMEEAAERRKGAIAAASNSAVGVGALGGTLSGKSFAEESAVVADYWLPPQLPARGSPAIPQAEQRDEVPSPRGSTEGHTAKLDDDASQRETIDALVARLPPHRRRELRTALAGGADGLV